MISLVDRIKIANAECRKRGYYPTVFNAMVERRGGGHNGTVAAIVWLMEKSDIVTSGYARCVHLKIEQHSLEAIVLEYPEIFSETTQACARFRRRLGRNPKLLKAATR